MKVPKTMLAFFVLFLIFCMNMCAEVKKSSGESNNGPWVTYSKSVPEKEEITCTMFTNSGKVTCFKQEKVGGWWISYYEDFDDVAVGAVGKILFDKLAQEYKAQEAEKKKKEEKRT